MRSWIIALSKYGYRIQQSASIREAVENPLRWQVRKKRYDLRSSDLRRILLQVIAETVRVHKFSIIVERSPDAGIPYPSEQGTTSNALFIAVQLI